MRKNTYITELEEMLDNADDATLWATWVDMKAQLSKLKRIETKIKAKLTETIGDKEAYEFEEGAGIYWQEKCYTTIPPEKAMQVLDDQDLFAQIVKVDKKKAKDILPKELYFELKKNEEVEKVTKSLMTGDIKK